MDPAASAGVSSSITSQPPAPWPCTVHMQIQPSDVAVDESLEILAKKLILYVDKGRDVWLGGSYRDSAFT